MLNQEVEGNAGTFIRRICFHKTKCCLCCADIDECEDRPDICSGGKCTNLVGSYRCTCVDGLMPENGHSGCIGVWLRLELYSQLVVNTAVRCSVAFFSTLFPLCFNAVPLNSRSFLCFFKVAYGCKSNWLCTKFCALLIHNIVAETNESQCRSRWMWKGKYETTASLFCLQILMSALWNPNLCRHGQCKNTPGSFVCECEEGYSVKEDNERAGCSGRDDVNC